MAASFILTQHKNIFDKSILRISKSGNSKFIKNPSTQNLLMTHEQASNHFVPVKVYPGMFSNEYAIELILKNGSIVTFFANKTLIKEENNQPKLRVYLYQQNRDSELVLLPSETFETATRWVEIPLQKIA